MWFAYTNNFANWHVLNIEQVKEIVAENKLKNKVSSLEDFAIETVDEQEKNFNNAMRVSSYAATAAWLAGVFNIIPALSFLGILAASGAQWVAGQVWHLGPGQIFWLCGACALLTGAYSAISRGRFIEAE